MTRKEIAIELYQKYESLGRDFTRGVSMKEHSKQCALIAVDEKIKLYNNLNELGLLHPNSIGLELHEIKTEIEKL